MKKQVCILVMGMHRSGTSAMTGVLEKLGVSLGNDLIDKNWDNPKGFFENKHFVEFNKKFLKHLHTPIEAPNFKMEVSDNQLQLLKDIISQQFKYDRCFAIKDPRIPFLFSMYKRALDELDIEIRCLIPIRHPLDVAKSLQRRNGFSTEKSLLMWSEHFFLTQKITREYPRLFVSFDELMSNPKVICQKISKRFSLEFLQDDDKIENFLEDDLKHYNTKAKDISDSFPDYLTKILNLIKEIDTKKAISEFDRLNREFLDYKDLFYNRELIENLDVFEETKEQLQQKTNELSQANQKIKQKNEHLEQKDRVVTQIKEQLQQKTNELSQANQKIKQKNEHLEQKDRVVTQANQKIKQKDRELDILKEELIDIYMSKSWRFTRIFRRTEEPEK